MKHATPKPAPIGPDDFVAECKRINQQIADLVARADARTKQTDCTGQEFDRFAMLAKAGILLTAAMMPVVKVITVSCDCPTCKEKRGAN